MQNLSDYLPYVYALLPLLFVYFIGMLVRVRKLNKRRRTNPIKVDIYLLGEAIPSVIEMLLALTATFGVVFSGHSGTDPKSVLANLLLAVYCAYRYGFTFDESLLTLTKPNAKPNET